MRGLFRRERFALRHQATFWLSETPEVIGSKSWDSSLPRIVTWVELTDRKRANVTRVFNTHFDHEGEQARLESARVLRGKIDALPALPTIVLGDFNTADDSAPHDVLTRPTASSLILRNAYRSIYPQRAVDEATYHGFMASDRGSRSIGFSIRRISAATPPAWKLGPPASAWRPIILPSGLSSRSCKETSHESLA